MAYKLIISNNKENFTEDKSKKEYNTVLSLIQNFKNSGKLFGNGDRNKIKLFDWNGKTINIKSFKIPNIINKVAYKYFRKSKAKRSFEYATILLEKGIGTPAPVSYTHLTLPTIRLTCRSRWSPDH